MPKILDLVNFHTSYGAQVRLLAYFYDEQLNSAHMAGYRPIRSHRAAFLALAKAQLPSTQSKERVFMLTGSYGTGKSHLCLMLANYFSLKPTDLEMEQLFADWQKRDPQSATQVRNWRGDGRYLVAICDFGEARPFEDMVLSAVELALEKENAADIALDTQYKSALRKIEEWERRKEKGEPSGAFDDFLAFLDDDGAGDDLELLKADLRQNKSAAMNRFQVAYEQATSQKLSLRNDNLIATLRDLLSSAEFRRRYKGLVILADEFGYALGDGRVPMSVFQGFAEMSKDGVGDMQLIFIGTGHRRFEAYGAQTALQVDFRVVKDRVTEVSLESEELEQIIAALVSPKIEDPLWQQEVEGRNKWLLTQMAGGAKKIGIFPYLSEPELRQQIVQNIYPMHPMATDCLTQMSRELGSDARSVFAFFRSEAKEVEGSYVWFVTTQDVTKPGGELNIYTPELLARYFQSEITTTNLSVRPEVRDHIRNYLGALEEVRRYAYKNKLSKEVDSFTQRVLDLIFVYRISGIMVTEENLQYGLSLQTPAEKKSLVSEAKALVKDRVIFLSPGGEYEFRRSDMVDIEMLIASFRQARTEQPLDLARNVEELISKRFDAYVEAKGHNQDYLADKRLLRVMATPKELSAKHTLADGSEGSFWQRCEQQQRARRNWNDRFDGMMVYVLCESEEEILTAQQAVKANNALDVTVGIPREPLPIRNSVLDLLAIQDFMKSDEYDKLGFQEKALVGERLGKDTDLSGFVGAFLRIRNQYLEGTRLRWYRDDGKVLVGEPNNEHQPADALLNRRFPQRIQVTHEYLAKSHPKTFAGASDAALREAVAKLIDIDKPISIDATAKENRGEIRYLRAALVHQGLLLQDGDYAATAATYQIERNIDKIRAKYPALAELIEKLKSIHPGQSLAIWPELSALIEPPYGSGPFALALFLAYAVRYFGDELRLRLNPTGLGYSPTNNPEIIIDVATGKHVNATVERRKLTQATNALINGVYAVFSSTPATAGEQQTLAEAWHALSTWWLQLPKLARVADIYASQSDELQRLVNYLASRGDSANGAQTMLEEIKQVYGYHENADLDMDEVGRLVEQLRVHKAVIDTRTTEIKTNLVRNLAGLFRPQGDTYQDYINTMVAWYKGLHPDQKLLKADWQTPTSRVLLEAISRLQNIETTLLEEIPASPAFNLKKVDDWALDHSASYRQTITATLNTIESSLPKVPPPIYTTSVEPFVFGGIPNVKFSGTVEFTVESPAEGITVRITTGENPMTATQFESVQSNTPWQTTIVESCTYRLVSQNATGDFGKVVELRFTNTDDGHKLIAEGGNKLLPEEREYRFRNPVDRNSLAVLLKDIVAHVLQDKRIPRQDIMAALEEVKSAATKLDAGE